MMGASRSLKKYERCPQVHTGCIYTSLCYQLKWKGTASTAGSCMGQAQSKRESTTPTTHTICFSLQSKPPWATLYAKRTSNETHLLNPTASEVVVSPLHLPSCLLPVHPFHKPQQPSGFLINFQTLKSNFSLFFPPRPGFQMDQFIVWSCGCLVWCKRRRNVSLAAVQSQIGLANHEISVLNQIRPWGANGCNGLSKLTDHISSTAGLKSCYNQWPRYYITNF